MSCNHLDDCPRCADIVDGLDAGIVNELEDEITILQEALKKANSQTEHFERKWYLCRDVLEEAHERLKQFEMAVDDFPSRDHVVFMHKLKSILDD